MICVSDINISCHTLGIWTVRYNDAVESMPKVPKAQFDAVLSKLLSTPPIQRSEISPKRRPKAKAKKRG
jgi:hypothetical protein